ncbi:MAG TPA: HAMP domain-containing sensor histidine kinase [Anaerolineae bacterium]|nr:HAMP domain-containing sensor histidine kinase [Anaerolineae bacterium]
MSLLHAIGHRFRSIRWRLVGSHLLLALLVVAVMAVITLSLVESFSHQRERDYLLDQATLVSQQALPLLVPEVQAEALFELAQTTATLSDVRVEIWDSAGDQIVNAPPAGQPSVWVILPPVGEGEAPERRKVIVGAGLPEESRALVDVYEVAAPPRSAEQLRLPIGPPGAPAGYVEVSEGPDLVSPALGTAREALLPATSIAVAIAVGLAVLTGHRLASPLEHLAGATQRMGAGDLAIRAPEYGSGEVGDLARQFNTMAARLEASFTDLAAERDALRAFIADASHELRTPITALRTFNELLQEGAAADPGARDEFLRESQAQIERLAWITHNLLDLSRLDAGLVTLDLVSCPVSDLLESVAAAFRPRAGERHLTFELAPPEPGLAVRCDRARIEIALSNLVDNALKYTAAGGTVTLGAHRQNGEIQLWVADSGAGLAPEEVQEVFHRYRRAGRADAEGSGLGLAIARRLIEAHGGRATVETAPGQGSRFILTLPL